MDASRNFAVLEGQVQIAYARAVTGSVTFGWLCDVFVAPEARGRGAGKLLIEGAVADPTATGDRRIVLSTAHAHGLHRQFGFAAPTHPEWLMERRL